MRLACVINSGCRWSTLRQEWLSADAKHATVRLLRFEECSICHDTRATITSPEIEESRLSKPETWYPEKVVV